jgi:hypothetical protein
LSGAADRGASVYHLIDDAVAREFPAQALPRAASLFVCAYGARSRQPLSDLATNCGLVVLTDHRHRALSLN